MRKVLFTTAIIVLAGISCSKPKYCWTCTQTTNITTFANGGNTPSQPSVTVSTICDKTDAEIDEIKKHGTSTRVSGNQTIRVNISCTRQ